MLAHPQLVFVFLARPGLGPNAVRLGEITFTLLRRGGLDGDRAVEAFRILLIYSLGFAAFEAPRLHAASPERTQEVESTFANLAEDTYPDMRRLASQLAAPTTDRNYHTGLRWMLDGISSALADEDVRQGSQPPADERGYYSGFGGKTRWVLPRRVRRFFDERPLIGLIAGGVFGLALVAFLVVADTSLVAQAYERSASSTVPAVVLGAGAALGTVLVFAWSRSRLERLRGTPRRVLGWAGIA